ncbi:ankyrin repeat and LEM domain-containing protein 1 [Culex pipiens pallens]|uniref:ankyrin repeat and LEM domain-containing protein 1 n=1 Tax=Culex pipiens pallens TaxID=42434 RepID=UPI00195308AC|nr:ankyrin repeat and LEM domain-containing protein 1 [Culex pipiens pallens]
MSRSANYLALCLLDALEDESLESLRVLLETYGANPNTVILEKNVAPIHLVVGAENLLLAERATQLMLDYGGDANLRSEEEGITPLHIAANLGRARLVEILLAGGGDLDVRDDENNRPVEYAIQGGFFEVVQIMQRFVFERKFEKKRQQILRKELSTPEGGFVKCLGGYLWVGGGGTPTKNSLTVQALDENKLTPNKVHYNFDATSPYYINITHRKRTPKSAILNDVQDSPPVEDDEIVMAKQNLFELTERNLTQFSRSMANGRRRSSYIECWRDKIAALRDRNKLSTNLEDIERILSGFSENSIQEQDSQIIELHTTLDASYQTAHEHAQPAEDSLRTNEFALALLPSPVPSPKPTTPNAIVQLTEEYIHTDDEAGLVFLEKKFHAPQVPAEPTTTTTRPRNPSISSQSTALTLPPLDYDTDVLRAELTNFGEPPGPITKHTKKLYLKKLVKYKRDPERALAQARDRRQPQYSVELLATLRCAQIFSRIPEHGPLEEEMCAEFVNGTDKTWREGHLKKSFIYLLIDPRISENLPAQQKVLGQTELWKRFLQSIFYVGKGKSSRPYSHLYDAMKLYQQKSCGSGGEGQLRAPDEHAPLQVEDEQIIFQSEERIERVCRASKILNRKQMADSEKLNRIIDVWRAGRGVSCLHVFHNIMPAEAYTREAAIIDALGMQNLTNLKRGDYYGKTQSWPMKQRKQLGILLLYKAMQIFLAEGESQLLPSDLI